jgi:hypothetical protein
MVSRIHPRPARALLVGLVVSAALAAMAAAPRQSEAPTPSPTQVPVSSTPTASPSEAATGTPTPSPLPTSTATHTPSVTFGPSGTASAAATATITATTTSGPTASATLEPATATQLPATVPPHTVLINEVAWSGTIASSSDEWMELHNPGADPVPLDGWTLADGNDISIGLTGTIGPYGFFLLERTDDTSVGSLPADLIYTGALTNSGETLELRGPSAELVDSANADGGGWPGGGASPRASMERLGGGDIPGNWTTFSGAGVATDRDGHPIAGTPRGANSPFITPPSPTPSATTPATITPPSPTAGPAADVIINEVAWAGTEASASDEWIELHNLEPGTVSLEGWHLVDGGDVDIALRGEIAPHGYFLLERSDDGTIADITADQIYTGTLRNSGERLELVDAGGELVDSANADGGGWPAGRADPRASMERRGGDDRSGNWATFTGYGGVGIDADGRPVGGTPRSSNSILVPTPTPTWIPGAVVINEVLIRPHYDWQGTGGVSTADEFIELYNRGPGSVWLRGWMLDDVSGSGSRPHPLPGITISPGGHAVFFRSMTHIALNDSGDSVRLLAPDGRMIDKIHYRRVRAYNLSYGRLPDGSNALAYGLWPTPGEANVLFKEGAEQAESTVLPEGFACHAGQRVDSRLPRLARQPARRRSLYRVRLLTCSSSP